MLKRLITDCRITYQISAREPMLIKSGLATIDGPDMAFVQTFKDDRWQVYLPGSSVKGLFRSHAERIVRTLKEHGACDPFAKEGPDRACGHRFKSSDRPWAIYRDSCPICRMFGSTGYGARVAVSDCYLVGSAKRQLRDGVGIDRFTGGASPGAKFNLEVVTDAVFQGELYLRNFELWQLALLGFVLQDLKDGFLQLGSGKSRGLGRIRGNVLEVVVSYLHPKAAELPADELWGVGAFTGDNEYGFSADDKVSCPDRPEMARHGLRWTLTWKGETVDRLFAAIAPAWVTFIEGYEARAEAAAGRE